MILIERKQCAVLPCIQYKLMINKERITTHFNVIRTVSVIPGIPGINRLAFTDPDWQARAFLIARLESLGMKVREDSFGNVIARLEGKNPNAPAIMVGSHTDSVPMGGHYDGLSGIVAANEALQSIQEDGIELDCPIEIVLFMCEESSRFGVATLGSQAMRGELTPEFLKERTDKDGNTLYDVLKSRGLSPDLVGSDPYTSPLKAFFELHIEQGSVLEEAGCPLGIVTGISAPTRYKVSIHGTANHSGATPMPLRRDGLCAAAEIILDVEATAKATNHPAVVATVGVIDAVPGVMNVIPGEVTLGIDIRSISAEAKKQVVDHILNNIQHIAQKRDIVIDTYEMSKQTPLPIAPEMLTFMEKVAVDNGYPYMLLPSGAGHDAMNWGDYTKVGMVFIPCKNGISHNPAEHIDLDDIVLGARYLESLLKAASSDSFQW